MKRKWGFLSNSFEVSTRRNHKKMLTMITKHTSALSVYEDPFIRNLYEQTKPVNDAYHAALSNIGRCKGGRKGETFRFRSMLKELYTKMIPRWEVNVLVRFPEDSPEYKAIFKGGRTSFRRGRYEERLTRLAVLAQCLRGFDGLFVIRNEVEEYYVKLNEAWNLAKGNSSKVKNATGELEAARRAAAMRMYANLGFLMGHFADNPAVVKRFFEVGKLRARRRKKISLKTAKQKAA